MHRATFDYFKTKTITKPTQQGRVSTSFAYYDSVLLLLSTARNSKLFCRYTGFQKGLWVTLPYLKHIFLIMTKPICIYTYTHTYIHTQMLLLKNLTHIILPKNQHVQALLEREWRLGCSPTLNVQITHEFYCQSVQYKVFLGLQMILVEGPGSWYSGG